jgi:DNA helicase-2/ATP-dependent DNA helicase PcrA
MRLWQSGRGARMMSYTPSQMSVINQAPEHTVVYAAPGSGKTAVLTEHLCELLRKSRLISNETMVLTFTRQAAIELKQRLMSVPGHNRNAMESVRVGTFHAQIFKAMLNISPNIPVLLGQQEQRKMLFTALLTQGIRNPRELQAFQNCLTRAHSFWPCLSLEKKYRKAAVQYQSMKQRVHRWDFDDIFTSFCNACETSQYLLKDFFRVSYLLVDEFQDTNQIQWHMIQWFAKLGTKVFVVGDDDQSIYGFRGASPKWLLDFQRYFKTARAYHLGTNFRCDQNIMMHASQLIQHNRIRMKKTFHCGSSRTGRCVVSMHRNEDNEARTVCQSIDAGLLLHPQASIAVLARTRQQVYAVYRRLQTAGHTAVQCRTFHDAKGKEWDIVHIVGALACNPYLAKQDKEDVEEERRLFYVAMTRARHALHIHVPREVRSRTVKPVPFIEESGL